MERRARRPGMLAGICLCALMMLWAGIARAEHSPMALAAPDGVRPYAPGEISLTLPESGELRLFAKTLQDKIPLYPAQTVEKGPLTLPFDGLDASGEPLPRGDIAILAELRGSAQSYQAEQMIRVLKPIPAIQYALLARESLPAAGGEELYADYQLTDTARLVVEISRKDGQPVKSWSLDAKDALPHRFRWDKTISGKPAEPGEYRIAFSLANSPQPAVTRSFSLTDEIPPALSPAPAKPGEFLPLATDDQSVWQAMMAPITVLDIGDMQHQQVFSEPSEKSERLGMVHGQTAGLEVLETGVSGFARIRAARHGDGAVITGFVPEKKLRVIRPDPRFGILIDKKSQTLRLYAAGEYRGQLPVSTGVYVPPGKDSFETISGAFITQDRIATFRQDGYQYDYAMRIDGGNLLHQVGYRSQDFSEQQKALGSKASHGCVRIDNRMNDVCINAWWLYANLPRNTKVLVMEDAALPGLTADDLPGEPSADAAAQALPPAASPSPALALPARTPSALPAASAEPGPHEVSITLSFAGDCVLGSEETTRKKPESFDSFIAEKGAAWPFSGFSEYFSQDDLTLVNLENVLMDSAQDRNLKRLHNFRGPARFAEILKAGSVELVNIANNHYPDYGAAGKRSTRSALNAAGLPYAGYSWLHAFEKQGIKVGFGGIRETIYHQDKNRIGREVAELKAKGCAYVVYTIHAGEEYAPRHNALQTEMARAAIDAGANLVIGHHPHVPQGIEMYKDGLIFYSLGNFVFGGNLALSTFDSLAVQLQLYFNQGALSETRVQLLPLLTSGASPMNDFRPVPAQGEDLQRILHTVNADSDYVYPEQFGFPAL